ncbi:hypothetical protein [Diplocloster hominis]|uniref:hypothetical protein n=1 Tax=Diplocloster hominis TaxID=3079010 RepID=UPI0031BAB0EB
MTIREVLEADCNVGRIEVTIRSRETTKYIMRYCIGQDVRPAISETLIYGSKCGDVYSDAEMNTLYIRQTINHYQISQLRGKGVIIKNIPTELLELSVGRMSPCYFGWSDGLHGYHFDCFVDTWNGIRGEYEQLTLDLD